MNDRIKILTASANPLGLLAFITSARYVGHCRSVAVKFEFQEISPNGGDQAPNDGKPWQTAVGGRFDLDELDNDGMLMSRALESLDAPRFDLAIGVQTFGDYPGQYEILCGLRACGLANAIGLANCYGDRLVELMKASHAPDLIEIDDAPELLPTGQDATILNGYERRSLGLARNACQNDLSSGSTNLVAERGEYVFCEYDVAIDASTETLLKRWRVRNVRYARDAPVLRTTEAS